MAKTPKTDDNLSSAAVGISKTSSGISAADINIQTKWDTVVVKPSSATTQTVTIGGANSIDQSAAYSNLDTKPVLPDKPPIAKVTNIGTNVASAELTAILGGIGNFDTASQATAGSDKMGIPKLIK